jgi:hypothetical protein
MTDRRAPGRYELGPVAALERGDLFLYEVDGRVVSPRIDIARLIVFQRLPEIVE